MSDIPSVKTDLVGCARCGADGHAGIVFRPLARPLVLPDSAIVLTYWAPCPTNGEPILMSSVPLQEQDAAP